MEYKYKLSPILIEQALTLIEFGNGGAQVSIKLNNGSVFKEALLSNSTAIIAMRGYNDLPFNINEIVEIFQTEEDQNPIEKGNWEFWDEWKQENKNT